MPEAEISIRSCLKQLVSCWSELWGVPNLTTAVNISFSNRLRSTLARCRPAEARIVLRADLADADQRYFAEVLCHELAHVATYMLHGAEAQPHGEHWRELVRAAGFEPQIRTRGNRLTQKPANRRLSTGLFEHRCPICQTVRIARRPISTWRCADCLDAGLEGALVITRWATTEKHRDR